MMAAPTTRWLRLLLPLLLLHGSRVGGQLILGTADSFLPEHLDASAATTGKTLEVTPLSDALVTNAAADATADTVAEDEGAAAAATESVSDPESNGANIADHDLIAVTDTPKEETTLPDFDDYTFNETDTEILDTSVTDVSHPGEVEEDVIDTEPEEVTNASSDLSRPDATPTSPLPPVQSTRPSSVVRELDDASGDFWRPNWPSQLLGSTEDPAQGPSISFSTGFSTPSLDSTATSATASAPLYTVSKAPVTQYYFDLASVAPTAVPGPLFDSDDVRSSPAAVSSVHPVPTHTLEAEELSSSISDLQSSAFMDVAGSPVTSTPLLPHSTLSSVITSEGHESIIPHSTTHALPLTSTALNEVVDGHVDNILVQEAESDKFVKENPEPSEAMPSEIGSTQKNFDNVENSTVSEDPDTVSSPVYTNEASQSTESSPSVFQSPTEPTSPSNSEPFTTTSSTTPGSVNPSSIRTSQPPKSSRIPLWQLLSQSSPSRPAKTPPSSTPLTPSVTTIAIDPVTPITSAPPSLQSTSVESSLVLDSSSAPNPTSSQLHSESTQESIISDDSDPSIPLDFNDPDEILTKVLKNETQNVTDNSTESRILTSESTKPPTFEIPELDTDEEAAQNLTTQESNIDSSLPSTTDQNISVDNPSTVKTVDNTLDGTHPNILSDDESPENKSQHGNGIFDDPKVVETIVTAARDKNDSVINPSEVLVTTPLTTLSDSWTPVIEVTESIPTLTSTSLVIETTSTSSTQNSLEILSGFTPIKSSMHTIPPSQSQVVPGVSPSSSSTVSSVDFASGTATTSAPAPDLSTPSAPSRTLTASLDSTAVYKPETTDDPIPTLLPQPVHPEEGEGEEGTRQEVSDKDTETDMELPSAAATPLPSPPATESSTTITTTTTTATTTTTSSTSSSSTTTENVPVTEASTTEPAPVAPDTTTAVTSTTSRMNDTAVAPGLVPMLTTTAVLDNGTVVVVELPYIRALVNYSFGEFCQRKHDLRALFAEWIIQDLNGSVRVTPEDIKFFAMDECDSIPVLQGKVYPNVGDGDPLDNVTHQDNKDNQDNQHNHTHVYFYVTNGGEMDPELTEKFPLFPTDLAISESLKYLVPQVMQLEVVRPDDSSSQDQLQEAAVGTSVIVIIVICSIVGVTIVVVLFFFMVVRRRGATNNNYGRRCTPVSMDAYSMDSVSVYHSFRRKSKRRASGRSLKSYLNQAFDDPNGPSRPLNFAKLTHFISDIDGVHEEFTTIPVNMPKYDELPSGVEDKNRYANVIPVPETRVLLKVTKDGRNCEYINANFVRGARNESKYYIATQAPLDDTVADFWRMIWEQETRVVVMLTDFVEKGIDKCADYLPPSETLDCHRLYGDFQVTLKSRDMREKFVVSNVQLKNLENNLMREVAHMWFTGWPASGVPNEEGGFISFILEVRRTRKKLRAKGPIVVHCSPGTGRTGTFLGSDIVMKQFEEHRTIDVPRTVYTIRRDRAGAVQTKEQYAFIYRVINLYASKLTSGNLESL